MQNILKSSAKNFLKAFLCSLLNKSLFWFSTPFSLKIVCAWSSKNPEFLLFSKTFCYFSSFAFFWPVTVKNNSIVIHCVGLTDFSSLIWLDFNFNLSFCATNLLTIDYRPLHSIFSLYLKSSRFSSLPSILGFSSAPKLWKCASIFLEAELRLRPEKKGLKWWWVNKMRWVNEYVMREKLRVCDPISYSVQTARSKLQPKCSLSLSQISKLSVNVQ